jgi:hypothetical protein
VEELEDAIDFLEGIDPEGVEMDDGDLAREARVRSSYMDWCKEFGKESDETRFNQFFKNYLEMEDFSKDTGKEMVLNEFADYTEEEYTAMQNDEPVEVEEKKETEADEAEAAAKAEEDAAAKAIAEMEAAAKAEEDAVAKAAADTEAAAKAEEDAAANAAAAKEEAAAAKAVEKVAAAKAKEEAARKAEEGKSYSVQNKQYFALSFGRNTIYLRCNVCLGASQLSLN